MDLRRRAYGMIGMAQRAGKLISGSDGVMSALGKGKAELIVITDDISRNTLDKILTAATKSENITGRAVTCFRFGSSAELGDALGKPSRTVAAVTDKAFAEGLSALLESIDEEEDI